MIKEVIFKLFGTYDNTVDINKDANGEGTLQRVVQLYGGYIDTELNPLIEELVANNLDIRTAYLNYLVYIEHTKGIGLVLGNSEVWRCRVLKHIHRWYNIKGTKRCYTLMFKMLGLTPTITEVFGAFGFDSSTTFDDEIRVFDGRCAACSSYTIELVGSGPITTELEAAINAVISFNQPINARLTSWTYNGTPIPLGSFDTSFNDDFT